jgi:transposase
MGKFLDYNPDQAYLLPPSVRDVLGSGHLCFFLRRVMAKLNLSAFREEYGSEGGPAYAPEMLASVWLYAYALSVTSSRRLEQRIREDLAFRYLAGGATPDHWTLNAFRRRHRKALNDLFTQVLEMARNTGLGRLGHVAIDSTRIAANASRDRIDSEQALRDERAHLRREIRRWQQQCDVDDPNEGAGMEVDQEVLAQLERRLTEVPARLERLQKSGLKKLSRSDADSRFLRQRGGFVLGYTATLAVSEDHLIVAQSVSQETNDTAALLPMIEAVEQHCRERPRRVSADSGFFSNENVQQLEQRNIDGYVPDANLARVLNRGGRLKGRAVRAAHRRMRRKLRDPVGRAMYARRKAIVEPVNGVLKEQRGMRRFRMRGLAKVSIEWTLATTAYNLTRLWRATHPLAPLAAAPILNAALLSALGFTVRAQSAKSSHRLFRPAGISSPMPATLPMLN